MKIVKLISLALFILLIAAQFVPVERSNPLATSEPAMPAPVKEILKRSCFDCHSNETRWPWYSYVAPVSWLVANDVKEGREHLNFSEWDNLSLKKKRKRLEECVEEIEEEKMPMPIYLITHPNARVGPEELALIRNWVNEALAQLPRVEGG